MVSTLPYSLRSSQEPHIFSALCIDPHPINIKGQFQLLLVLRNVCCFSKTCEYAVALHNMGRYVSRILLLLSVKFITKC
jgi:hypothetical protein